MSHSIMFHHFHGSYHPKTQGSISREQFENIISWLSKGFNILDPQEYKNKIFNNTILKKDICLSFDDALLCQFDIAFPVLQKKKIKAYFFIYSAPILGEANNMEVFRYFRTVAYNNLNDFYESFFKKIIKSNGEEYKKEKKIFKEKKYLSSFPFYSYNDRWFRFLRDKFLSKHMYEKVMFELIKEKGFKINNIVKKLWMKESDILYLKKCGHAIGLHSYSHPMMFHLLNEQDQYKEYDKNLKHLESILGKGSIESMSHPCGNYNQMSLSVLKKLGIRIGFLSNMNIKKIRSSLEVPREDHTNILMKMKNENYNI